MAIRSLSSQGTRGNNLYLSGYVFLICQLDEVDFTIRPITFYIVQGLPLLQGGIIEELIDPRLENDYVHEQVKSVMHAAELCLSPVPEQRPRMSQVSFLSESLVSAKSTVICVFLMTHMFQNVNTSAGSENTGRRYARQHGEWVQAAIP